MSETAEERLAKLLAWDHCCDHEYTRLESFCRDCTVVEIHAAEEAVRAEERERLRTHFTSLTSTEIDGMSEETAKTELRYACGVITLMDEQNTADAIREEK